MTEPALRIYTAPGEAADLDEMLDARGLEFHEVGHISELEQASEPGVLFLSRGLLGVGGILESLIALPSHVVVVAADDGARSAATQVGRLFLASPELAPGEAPLLRALRSAGAHARVLARVSALEAGVRGAADAGGVAGGHIAADAAAGHIAADAAAGEASRGGRSTP